MASLHRDKLLAKTITSGAKAGPSVAGLPSAQANTRGETMDKHLAALLDRAPKAIREAYLAGESKHIFPIALCREFSLGYALEARSEKDWERLYRLMPVTPY